jgi:hypothetical protein
VNHPVVSGNAEPEVGGRRRRRNPADLVVRPYRREAINFSDLTERRALKLSAVLHYVARAHFGAWHRRVPGPDFSESTGVFTPLFFVDVETTDCTLDPMRPLLVRGETFLAKTLDAAGAIDHLVREGRHSLLTRDGEGTETVVAAARLMNVFTRYDPDPTLRRVTALPEWMHLGDAPSRITQLPSLDSLVVGERAPDFAEPTVHAWHYGQTDSNRHVNGMEYLRVMECYVADQLHRAGHDLRPLCFRRARIVYRKPCFRGEGYRCAAWFRGEAPLIVAGAIYKAGEQPAAKPAVAIELTLGQHEAA